MSKKAVGKHVQVLGLVVDDVGFRGSVLEGFKA